MSQQPTHLAVLSELLCATASGDRDAFARLYRLTSAKLYAVALRILRYEDQAQDCLQEAYLNIWNKAGSYQPHRAAPTTWMATVVRHRALDMLRRQRPELSGYDEDMFDRLLDHDDAGGDPVYDDTGKLLAHCLDEIREQQREAVQLAYYEGLTHPELAERMAVPLGTVKTWIRRGLAQLKQCLER